MAQRFKDQGGVATMDPSGLRRWAQSRYVRFLSSEGRLARQRQRAERRRRAQGRAHVVEYFHQVDDPYSHLAAQLLEPLAQRYGVDVHCRLVRGPEGANVSDPERLLGYARRDCGCIAAQYGLAFPDAGEAPSEPALDRALSLLAALDDRARVHELAAVSGALWSGDVARLNRMAAASGRAGPAEVSRQVDAGTARRAALKHYAGAMFYYEGEWYWGVDRLHHLEARLAALGLDTTPREAPLAPCPRVDAGGPADCQALTLEFFPSLRSPYTAIVFDETVALAAETGVNFKVRPVLPMVMRGVPATLEKGTYIFLDAAREARRRGVAFGKFYDPIGEPVRRCYSLYPWAVEQGRGTALLSGFLRHAFASGTKTTTNRGLRRVVEGAGLSWHDAKRQLGRPEWEAQLEDNRLREPLINYFAAALQPQLFRDKARLAGNGPSPCQEG